MKRWTKVLTATLAVMMVISLAACSSDSSESSEGGTDTFTSASTSSTYYYAEYALEGDELMDAINSYSGFYVVCNVNPDGTPQAGFYIYGCVKNEDKYYIQLGLADNQGRENFLANGTAVAIYASAPSDMPWAMAGAKMQLELVTDEDLLAVLNPTEIETALYGEIVEIGPLG